jgi:S-(hydroxymethyl)glutathione dehydrogenase/alcohol dehydrogenase
LFLTFCDGGDKGKGQTIIIGEGNHATVEINFVRLVFGGNLKGSIFGGIKVKTDLPVIIEKCKNKVTSYFYFYFLF